jgi:predicted nucleotidyltransferase
MRLRDRDAIVTREGLIFRVFGYSHPQNAYICDAEYASAKIFKSTDPRALRNGGNQIFYKFYDDQGWKLIFNKYPQYTIFHEMLQQKVVGVDQSEIVEARKPEERLQVIIKSSPADALEVATHRALKIIVKCSSLSTKSFGIFGSMFHGFHHPNFSDIDLLVYGRKEITKAREALNGLYGERASGFRNEFETFEAVKGKSWRFRNFSITEFLWHQKRKLIYGLYDDSVTGRTIKVEFEPVKKWSEIASEYDTRTRILRKDWVKIIARVINDADSPFIPSIYAIQPLEVVTGTRKAVDAVRVVSYMEEFRLQAQKDEKVCVEGNLEEIVSPKGNFYQVTLTYCPRYYEQVLKVADSAS